MRQFDLATVCKWMGNSPAVAARHYAMSADLDGDYRRAAGLEAGAVKGAVHAQQNAQQSADSTDGQPMTSKDEVNENAPETRGEIDACHVSAFADQTDEWAVQGSNL